MKAKRTLALEIRIKMAFEEDQQGNVAGQISVECVDRSDYVKWMAASFLADDLERLMRNYWDHTFKTSEDGTSSKTVKLADGGAA